MSRTSIPVFLLRTLHGAFALYFIGCIGIIYYTAFTLSLGFPFYLAVASLILEGTMVFLLNGGDCPLIHIQKKLDDPVPFFNLFLPAHLAKKAVPFFTMVTCVGILLILIRFFVMNT